ncbi:hypothetical protein ACOKFD_13080 [Flagellimonas sp. S174]
MNSNFFNWECKKTGIGTGLPYELTDAWYGLMSVGFEWSEVGGQ